MNELAGQSLGGYLLEEEIGRGSMGMVKVKKTKNQRKKIHLKKKKLR